MYIKEERKRSDKHESHEKCKLKASNDSNNLILFYGSTNRVEFINICQCRKEIITSQKPVHQEKQDNNLNLTYNQRFRIIVVEC